jgi:phosphate transport system permease protein
MTLTRPNHPQQTPRRGSPVSETATARRPRQRRGDLIFSGAARVAALTIMVALAGVAIFLTIEGIPAVDAPPSQLAGAENLAAFVGPLLFGTVLAALIALVIATPFSLGVALVISHYAPRRLSRPVGYAIDLLAAVPSVVYGLWGIAYLGPKLAPVFAWLERNLGFLPFFAGPASTTGRTILTAGIVLAIMALPIITAITREIFSQTPTLQQEAALALGATRWEMVRLAVLPYGRSGIVSAVMLGLGRALGETMAVAMVLSATSGVVTFNLIGTVNPSTIAANIANSFPEATGLGVNALIASGLVLFVITFGVNFAARAIVARSEKGLYS